MNRVYPNRIDWENEPSTNTPINETNLNKIDYAVYEIDGRVVNYDLTKANQSDLLQTIKTLTYNTTTGVFVFEFWNGGTYTVDLNIEKIPVSFSMSESGVITMVTADGTTYTCDISTLIKLYTFVDSSEIDFTTTTDASGNKNITASIKTGSIAAEKLQPNFLADCIAAKNAAELAASNAQQSEDDANASALVSEGWANGKQNGVPVTEGSPYYHNNAEYWKDQANPTRLASLTDVAFGTLKDDEIIVYDATSQKWKNEVGVSADLKSNTTGQFNTRTGGKLESCIINIEPKQSGSGTPSPQNVRPITGHTAVEVDNNDGNNLANQSAFVVGSIGGTGQDTTSDRRLRSPLISVKPNTAYGFSVNSGLWVMEIHEYDVNGSWLRYSAKNTQTATHTFGADAYFTKILVKKSDNSVITDNSILTQMMMNEGALKPYTPYIGYTITINLGGTYYGGSLDVVSGVLTVDKGFITYNGSEAWNKHSTDTQAWFYVNASMPSSRQYLSSNYFKSSNTNEENAVWGVYAQIHVHPDSNISPSGQTDSGLAEFKTWLSTHNLQVVYPLATPLTIQLSPQQINTLIGENHLDVPLEGQTLDSAVYRELFAWDDVNDVVKAVDDKNADVSAIGTDESGRATASKAYAIGEHFYKDGKFCTAKTAIASGATFTLNTNYVEGSVATEITNKIVTDDFTISVGNVASGTAGAEITQSVAKTGYEAVGVVIREGSGLRWTVCDYLLIIKNNVLSIFANNFSSNNASSVSIKVRVTYAKI